MLKFCITLSDGDVIGTKAPATTDGNDDIDADSSGHAPSAPDDTSIQHPRCRCGCDADIITTHVGTFRLGWADGPFCIKRGWVVAIPMPRTWMGPRACPLF